MFDGRHRKTTPVLCLLIKLIVRNAWNGIKQTSSSCTCSYNHISFVVTAAGWVQMWTCLQIYRNRNCVPVLITFKKIGNSGDIYLLAGYFPLNLWNARTRKVNIYGPVWESCARRRPCGWSWVVLAAALLSDTGRHNWPPCRRHSH